MEYRTAYVYIRNEFAGTLRETETGYEFAYDKTYLCQEFASPVSLTMPLKEESYCSNTLFSFFDGLIPEGWLLDVLVHNWKLNREDRFGLLLHACVDCIGNVSIQEEIRA